MDWRMGGVLAAVGVALGCSPAPPDGEELPPKVEAERCVLPDDTGVAPPPRAVVLGDGEPDVFEPYLDGHEVPLQLGWQGGYMITPRVKVAALPGDGDSVCWRVRVKNDIDEGSVAPGVITQLVFRRVGEAFFSDAINNLLSYDEETLLGQPLQLEVTTSGNGIDEVVTLSLVLQ